MRAFVVTGPGQGAVHDVPAPTADAGEVVVDIHRVGLCGTDVEFWTGEMAYLHTGQAAYPMRLGHEWCGVVAAIGAGVAESWLGARVTGDTMIGCGHCERCRAGRHNVCADRFEIGIRGGFAGALAEQLLVPERALIALPDEMDDVAGALVEPGGNALRAMQAAVIAPGENALVLGTGTIGLLVAQFARSLGARVHLMGASPQGMEFARALDFTVSTQAELPIGPWHAVIDASNAAALPALALDLVEPGRRVVYIGLAGTPSLIDTRSLALKDVTAVGILAASQGLAGTVEAYARGQIDPRPLVAATVGLERTGDILAGWRPETKSAGPKIHLDPRH